MLQAVRTDWTTAPVAPALAGALALVHRLTTEPTAVDAAFVDDLESRGLTVEAIEAASTVAFRYAVINRAADVFAFALPTSAQNARIARVLSWANRLAPAPAPEPLFTRGADGRWRPTDVETARERFLTAPGVTPEALRRSAEAFAARWFGAEREAPDPQEPELGFVGRVAAFPASMDDAGVQVLRDHGHDDEAIFELTMAASLGVACAGVEPLAAVLAARSG